MKLYGRIKEVLTRDKENKEVCPYCSGDEKIISDCGYDLESGIFSTADIDIHYGTLRINFLASYYCEELQKNGKLEEKVFDSEIAENIQINYCPMCSRKLK